MPSRKADGGDGSTPVVLRDLAADDTELLLRLHREVIAPSFPPNELMTYGELVSAFEHAGGDQLGVVALDAGGSLVGGALGERYCDAAVLLLAYLAARPDLRGRGIGTRIMAAVAERWYPTCRLALGELEDPRVHPGTLQDAVLRLRFYARFGVRLLRAPFVQPRLRETSERVPGLLLGVFHSAPDVLEADGAVDGGLVRAFIREYFAVCEGEAVVAGDAEVARLLRRYTGERLGTVPPEEYAEILPLED